MLQCVAVCCSVLQCVAVRCSKLQCVVFVFVSMIELRGFGIVCSSVLQGVAVCCSEMQEVAVRCVCVRGYDEVARIR